MFKTLIIDRRHDTTLSTDVLYISLVQCDQYLSYHIVFEESGGQFSAAKVYKLYEVGEQSEQQWWVGVVNAAIRDMLYDEDYFPYNDVDCYLSGDGSWLHVSEDDLSPDKWTLLSMYPKWNA